MSAQQINNIRQSLDALRDDIQVGIDTETKQVSAYLVAVRLTLDAVNQILFLAEVRAHNAVVE